MSDTQFMLEFISAWYDDGDGRLYMNEIQKNIIVSALEKRIPKKPTFVKKLADGSVHYGCPGCRTPWGYVNPHWVKFCPNCGQALDWSETEGV